MPQPRKSQISIDATPYYHCVSRCVRRAFLCGKDKFIERSFEHHQAFIETELLRLGQAFLLDVVGYARYLRNTGSIYVSTLKVDLVTGGIKV